MKNIYENFEEIADGFCSGDSVTHVFSPHATEECLGWQKGAREFAKFLDGAGMKIVANPEIYDKLWETAANNV